MPKSKDLTVQKEEIKALIEKIRAKVSEDPSKASRLIEGWAKMPAQANQTPSKKSQNSRKKSA
jgi:hypothetical protein